MENKSPPSTESPEKHATLEFFQTPPEVKIAIANLIKMVSIGRITLGTYEKDTEYWHTGALTENSFDVDSLTMDYDRITSSEDVDDHLEYTDRAFELPRTSPTWDAHERSTEQGTRAHLFSMTDPDDEAALKKIGILIETTTTKSVTKLSAVVFYKTVNPHNGQIWTTPAQPRTTLYRVKDSNNDASTDPDNMGSQDWYHTVMTGT